MQLDELEALLQTLPLSMGHEKRAQEDLQQHLSSLNVPFQREVYFSNLDIPDFVIPTAQGDVVIELKIRAQRKRIYKQLERYAKHQRIHALILLSATPMSLPERINGKPVTVVSMGGGWL